MNQKPVRSSDGSWIVFSLTSFKIVVVQNQSLTGCEMGSAQQL